MVFLESILVLLVTFNSVDGFSVSPRTITGKIQPHSASILIKNENAKAARDIAIISHRYSSRTKSFSKLNLSQQKQSEDEEQQDLSGLILRDENTFLTSAFDALKEEDKYDAVLTGLCSKILDGDNLNSETASEEGLYGTLDLIQEMNNRGVPASPRSLSALIDVAAQSQSAVSMSNVLSLSIRNGGVQFYGSLQDTIEEFPQIQNYEYLFTTDAKNKKNSGGFFDSVTSAFSGTTSAEETSAMERKLKSLESIPADNRLKEISSALTFSGVIFALLILSNSVGSGPLLNDDGLNFSSAIATLASLALNGIIGVAIIDNAYDVLKTLFGLINNSLLQKQELKLGLPEKDNMPLGIGKGEASSTVVAGLTRLLSVDTERECQCEAAALFVGYSLGLPCFAFRPNSLEAVVLIFESIRSKDSSSMDPLLSSSGVLKILMWLLAPVAIENMKHPQLIQSDPREASGLTQRLGKSCQERNIDLEDILPPNISFDKNAAVDVADSRELLLQWAYNEAKGLLLRNKDVVEELTERLAGGAATVGDSIAVLEGWE